MGEIAERFKTKGHLDDDFQIGESRYDVDGYIVQLADVIDQEPRKKWPDGPPVRLQLVEKNGAWTIRDVD